MEKKLYEVDLFVPVRDFLISRGYEVRSELNYCDITAVKGNELLVVELKKNLTIELLTQAVKRQKVAEAVYMAIPKPKKLLFSSKWKDICHLLRRLELGLLLVSFKGDTSFIEVALEPTAFDRAKSIQANKKTRKKLLDEFGGRNRDLNIGGSKGKKLVTAYRESVLYIACCLDLYGELSLKQLRELGADSKRIVSILQKDFYGWFTRISKGIYALNETGKENLKVYHELSEIFRKQILELKSS